MEWASKDNLDCPSVARRERPPGSIAPRADLRDGPWGNLGQRAARWSALGREASAMKRSKARWSASIPSTQNPVGFTPRVGSIPSSGTIRRGPHSVTGLAHGTPAFMGRGECPERAQRVEGQPATRSPSDTYGDRGSTQPLREDRRGATVGQFAGKPTAWPGSPDRAEADR